MKTRYMITTLLILTSSFCFGEIRNGYEKGIKDARKSLQSLYTLQLSVGLSSRERKMVESKIETVTNFISFHELTEYLINQFRIISPEIFSQVDTIKDGKGRTTDVYIKFIPQNEATVNAAGISCVAQSEFDDDLCVSEYGEGTISVKVWIFNRALLALSHEFGHINYLTPNLAVYLNYYRNKYQKKPDAPNCFGHEVDDLSGRNANSFEKKFKKKLIEYTRTQDERLRTPISLVQDIRKRIQAERGEMDPIAAI
jgi:hypothetical protein